MGHSPVATAPAVAGSRRGGRPGLVAALAVTQTVGYGILYYAFSVVLGPMSAELRISTATAAGALTVAVLVTGAMSIPVGRRLDVRGGHALMTTGSVLGVIGVAAWSQVHTVTQLYAVFVLVGVASAMVLYEAAFAVVVAACDPARRTKALLAITLVAGLASSIFIPLTGQLVAAHGWRRTLVILALTYAAITVPLHAVGLRRTASAADSGHRRKGAAARVLRDKGFWLLGGALVLHSAALAVVAVHIVLYLVTLGHPPAVAAGLAGLLGLLSVTGRVVTTVSLRWLPMASIAAGIFVLQGLAIAVLPWVGHHRTGAVVCIVLFGLGFGVAAIAKPAILLDRYGATGYATIAGTLATPVIVARATAPLGAALLAGATGYRTVILLVAASCVAGGLALVLTYLKERC